MFEAHERCAGSARGFGLAAECGKFSFANRGAAAHGLPERSDFIVRQRAPVTERERAIVERADSAAVKVHQMQIERAAHVPDLAISALGERQLELARGFTRRDETSALCREPLALVHYASRQLSQSRIVR